MSKQCVGRAESYLSTTQMAITVATMLTALVIMEDIREAVTPMPITWKIWGANCARTLWRSARTNQLIGSANRHQHECRFRLAWGARGKSRVPFNVSWKKHQWIAGERQPYASVSDICQNGHDARASCATARDAGCLVGRRLTNMMAFMPVNCWAMGMMTAANRIWG